MSSFSDRVESCNKMDWLGNMEGGGNKLREAFGD